jgi:hypothetical protein
MRYALPVTICQDYAVVGGESICAWTPAYGTVTEAIEPPDLGEALPEFEQALAWVGHCVLRSTFETKEPILVMVNLAQAKQRVGTYVTLDSDDTDFSCFCRFCFTQIPRLVGA